MNTLGQPYRITREITHLREGGEWKPVVLDFLMQPTTPRQRIRTEIANLRAEAHRRNESDAYSGSHGSGGSLLTAKADAMQYVLDVLTADADA